MKLSHRSFPHPVVGNADDVVDAAFQAAISVYNDRVNYYICVKLQCSSNTISKLVKKGDAVYVLHVECGNTLYRSATEFTQVEREFMIGGENLNSTVEVNVVAQAKRDINKYKVEQAHPDYGDAAFSISAGDILAVSEGFTFDADINFDALRSMSSIMQIKPRKDTGDAPMEVDLSDEKITIYLSHVDFENYKIIRAHQVLSASLIATLVLPALVDALTDLKGEHSDVEDTRWCRCLKRRIEHAGFSLESNPLRLAQDLLELPIKRGRLCRPEPCLSRVSSERCIMEYVRALNRKFMNRLLDSLAENVNRYTEDESWVGEWVGKTAWEFLTPCELAAPLELLLPDEGNLFDLENAIRMHKALPTLTPVQAQDPRLWTRLTHVELWEYMRLRWPVEKYLEPEVNLNPIRDRYFVVQRQSRALVRNGAARLWWAAKMTFDPDRDNPYELTNVLLSRLDIFKNLLERNFGRAVSVSRTFLEFLLLNKKECLSSGEKARQLVRDLSKAVNLHGGVCVLDCKTSTALMDFLNREKDRLVAKKNGAVASGEHDADEDE